MKKILFLLAFVFAVTRPALAQINTISGPTCVAQGSTVNYTLSSDAGSFSYSVSWGTLSTGGFSGTSTTTTKVITVTWTTGRPTTPSTAL